MKRKHKGDDTTDVKHTIHSDQTVHKKHRVDTHPLKTAPATGIFSVTETVLIHTGDFLTYSDVSHLCQVHSHFRRLFSLSIHTKEPSRFIKQLSRLVIQCPKQTGDWDILVKSGKLEALLGISTKAFREIHLKNVYVHLSQLWSRCNATTKRLSLNHIRMHERSKSETESIASISSEMGIARCSRLRHLHLAHLSIHMLVECLDHVPGARIKTFHLQAPRGSRELYDYIQHKDRLEKSLILFARKTPRLKSVCFTHSMPLPTTMHSILNDWKQLISLELHDIVRHDMSSSLPNQPHPTLCYLSLQSSLVSHTYSMMHDKIARYIPRLTRLNLQKTLGFEQSQLVFMMQNCKQLHTLDLSHFNPRTSFNKTTQQQLFASKPMTWIRKLNLTGWVRLNDAVLSMLLCCCPQLQEIHLVSCSRLTVQSLSALLSHATLQKVMLDTRLLSRHSCLSNRMSPSNSNSGCVCEFKPCSLPEKWLRTHLPQLTVVQETASSMSILKESKTVSRHLDWMDLTDVNLYSDRDSNSESDSESHSESESDSDSDSLFDHEMDVVHEHGSLLPFAIGIRGVPSLMNS